MKKKSMLFSAFYHQKEQQSFAVRASVLRANYRHLCWSSYLWIGPCSVSWNASFTGAFIVCDFLIWLCTSRSLSMILWRDLCRICWHDKIEFGMKLRVCHFVSAELDPWGLLSMSIDGSFLWVCSLQSVGQTNPILKSSFSISLSLKEIFSFQLRSRNFVFIALVSV